MSKEKEKLPIIKAKKVAKSLIVMIGNKKFTIPNITDKDVKTIQTKILIYEKAPTIKRKDEILEIVDLAGQKLEKAKSVEKGLKKAVKKASEGDRRIISRISKKIKIALEKKKVTRKVADLLVPTKTGLAMRGAEAIEMPKLLIERIEEFLDAGVDIKPLINFWSLALLNPNPIARTKLFSYLKSNGITITPSGYFVTYRMVKDHDKLGKKLPNETYTDANSYSMKYSPGTVCRIPRSQCDEDGSRDCSKGLHVGTPKFIGIIAEKKLFRKAKNVQVDKLVAGENVGEGYGFITKKVTTKEQHYDSYGTGYDKPVEKDQQFDESFGNQAIICLVNPQHVVSVPESNTRKMRTCEFYFAKTTTPEEVIDMVEKDYLLFDGDYQSFELADLQKALKNVELKKYYDAKSETGSNVEKLKGKLEEVRTEIRIGEDPISNNLDLPALKAIIKQRMITLK